MKRRDDDDSEINWVDNDNEGGGGGADDYYGSDAAEQPQREQEQDEDDNDDECGFDLRSTGSAPLLGWQKQRQSQTRQQQQQRSGTGNQKGIKLNSNYDEDAEIDAFHRRGRTSGKNKGVRDWAKERNADDAEGRDCGRMGEDETRAGDSSGAMSLEREESGDTECRYSGSNCRGGGAEGGSSSNNNNGCDATPQPLPSSVIGIEDELETVILRLTTPEHGEGAGGSPTTACVT